MKDSVSKLHRFIACIQKKFQSKYSCMLSVCDFSKLEGNMCTFVRIKVYKGSLQVLLTLLERSIHTWNIGPLHRQTHKNIHTQYTHTTQT